MRALLVERLIKQLEQEQQFCMLHPVGLARELPISLEPRS
jgi:hypothetical protein